MNLFLAFFILFFVMPLQAMDLSSEPESKNYEILKVERIQIPCAKEYEIEHHGPNDGRISKSTGRAMKDFLHGYQYFRNQCGLYEYQFKMHFRALGENAKNLCPWKTPHGRQLLDPRVQADCLANMHRFCARNIANLCASGTWKYSTEKNCVNSEKFVKDMLVYQRDFALENEPSDSETVRKALTAKLPENCRIFIFKNDSPMPAPLPTLKNSEGGTK